MPLKAGEMSLHNYCAAHGSARDFDPVAASFHAKAARAMRDALYAGAEKNPQRL